MAGEAHNSPQSDRGRAACTREADALDATRRVGETARQLGSLAILGAGYVGTEVARLAIRRGWRVAAVTRNSEKAQALRALGCERVVVADLVEERWHAGIGGGFSFVLNCTSPSDGTIGGYRRSFVDVTRAIGRWLATLEPGGTLVHTSSTGVYPQGGGKRVDEDAPTEEGEGRGALLRNGEVVIESAARDAAWRSFVLRLAGIYGPGRHHLLDRVRAGQGLAGDPGVHLNVIHRDDICSAIFACFLAGAAVGSTIFNLSDGGPGTREEVAAWLAARLGMPAPRFSGSTGTNPFGRRATPDRLVDSGKIREILGWAPRHPDFRSGFEQILAVD